jgi:acetolactate synthase-1/2/3 large subunit
MTLTVVDRFARILATLGVRRAYGLPGEDHMPMLQALEDAGVRYYTASNESSAVIMAATDSAVSGDIGIAIVSMATGVSNAMNGLLHASMEGLPVLLLSGRWPAARESLVVRQGYDPEQMARTCTKWTTTIRTAADPAAMLCKAVEIATSERPGPVYVELPDEIAGAECDATDDAMVDEFARRLRRPRAERSEVLLAPSDIEALAARLSAASRPAVVMGGRADAVDRKVITRFAETFRAPVFTTPAQKGVVDPSSPWFAGAFLNGNPEKELLDRCDLILALAPEAFDYLNRAWPKPEATVAVSSTPLHEWLFPYGTRLVASPEGVLRQLLERATPGAAQWEEREVAGYRSTVSAMLLGTPGTHMSVVEAVNAALQSSPPDTCVVADAGFSKPVVTMLSETAQPRHFLASNALSTMGFGIPAALAASLAGQSPVLGFMGDGSLLMRATELVVARGIPHPPVFVAVMDRSLSQIEIKQERRGLAEVGVELPDLSCARIGAAFGVRGVDVEDVDSLELAVKEAFAGSECVLIGAHVDGADSRRLFDVLRG